MKIFVLNVGSTSVKYHLFDMDTEATLASGIVDRVGKPGASHVWRVGDERSEAAVSAADARASRPARAGSAHGGPGLLLQGACPSVLDQRLDQHVEAAVEDRR